MCILYVSWYVLVFHRLPHGRTINSLQVGVHDWNKREILEDKIIENRREYTNIYSFVHLQIYTNIPQAFVEKYTWPRSSAAVGFAPSLSASIPIPSLPLFLFLTLSSPLLFFFFSHTRWGVTLLFVDFAVFAAVIRFCWWVRFFFFFVYVLWYYSPSPRMRTMREYNEEPEKDENRNKNYTSTSDLNRSLHEDPKILRRTRWFHNALRCDSHSYQAVTWPPIDWHQYIATTLRWTPPLYPLYPLSCFMARIYSR